MPVIVKTVGVVFLALSLIVVGDTAGKMLTVMGFSPYFVGWARFAIAAVVLLPMSGLKPVEWKYLFSPGVLVRACFIIIAVCSILTALRTEPIANVYGAFFVSPVVSYFLAALVLKEKITPVRTVLLLFGLVGVMLVVKPGFGATIGIAFALLAGCMHGSYLVATRWLSGDYRPRFLMISQLLIGGAVLAPLGLNTEMGAFDTMALWLIFISAIGSAAGNFLLVLANKSTPASLIAPLIYTQLVAATVAGGLVFGDWPDLVAMIGLGIILISGLLSFVVAQGRTPPIGNVP